jgi:hypothetical protein
MATSLSAAVAARSAGRELDLVARGYNGPKYYINKYDDPPARRPQKFSTARCGILKVRAGTKFLLGYLRFDPDPWTAGLDRPQCGHLNDWRGRSGRFQKQTNCRTKT